MSLDAQLVSLGRARAQSICIKCLTENIAAVVLIRTAKPMAVSPLRRQGRSAYYYLFPRGNGSRMAAAKLPHI